VARVAQAIVEEKTSIIDLDLKAYFDNVQHYLVLEKVAKRVQDNAVMHLLKMILKATGNKGVPQGGVISPLLSNLYLNEVDRMLEKAVDVTRRGKSTNVEYARFADDLVVLIDAERRNDWLVKAVNKRLREEFAKLRVAVNEDKSRVVDLKKGESFTFLGFEYRRVLSLQRKWRPYYAPKLKKRTALFENLREIFRQHVSWPVEKVILRESILSCGAGSTTFG
jgi:RNA-directed DNA polymerase